MIGTIIELCLFIIATAFFPPPPTHTHTIMNANMIS